MIDQFEASYSVPWTACSEETIDTLSESANPWMWASQMCEALGEGGELNPRILEESWASGLPAGQEAVRSKRGFVSGTNVGSVTFAELNGFGRSLFAAVGEQPATQAAHNQPAYPANGYGADWLSDPEQSRWSEGAEKFMLEASAATDPGERADAIGKPRTMSYKSACGVLGVSVDSNDAQIKTAYRRMVSAWHPDRLEQSGEKVRALATEKMAAINEAYHFLRGGTLARVQ
jgi:hypothetical protein